MAEIEEALLTTMTTALGHARVYPMVLPEGVTLPAVRYTRLGSDREVTMGSNPGMCHAMFQVDVWAATYAEVKADATTLRGALERWRGTVEGIVIQDTMYLSDDDDYDPETKEYRVIIRIKITHLE